MTAADPAPRSPARPLLAVALFLVGATLFATAYCQAPLYYSNQNQYFLHGLAAAGEGLLREDWLASTRDPTPLFSGLVAVTARHAPPWMFHVYQGLLLGAYAAAMLGLFVALAGKEIAARRWPVFVVLLVAVHSALARWLSYRLLGLDYPWYLQAGVAGQYILGAMLQPSTFGVLLVVAVCLFVHGHAFLAATCAALAATMHSTYLLPAGLLTVGFLTALVVEGRIRQAVKLGSWALALVLPVTVYVLLTFGPTSAATFAAAQDVIANFRIPHHARPDLWLDTIAVFQLAWVVLALVLSRRSRLFLVLAGPFALMALLTLAQVATGSTTLALLFPWRVSAVLVPIATTVVLTRLAAAPARALDGPAVRAAAVLGVLALVGAGVWINAGRLAFRSADEELPLMDFVRRSRAPGDVYFLPVQVPNLMKNTRGSLSSDFKPVAAKRSDKRIIPIGLQRFRLGTGTPIFVDFKSIPYKDVEVIEWRERIRVAEVVQEQFRAGQVSEVVAELRRRGVTHLVQPTTMPLPAFGASTVGLLSAALGQGPFLTASALFPGRAGLPRAGLEQVYEDPYYQVYRVSPGQGRTKQSPQGMR